MCPRRRHPARANLRLTHRNCLALRFAQSPASRHPPRHAPRRRNLHHCASALPRPRPPRLPLAPLCLTSSARPVSCFGVALPLAFAPCPSPLALAPHATDTRKASPRMTTPRRWAIGLTLG